MNAQRLQNLLAPAALAAVSALALAACDGISGSGFNCAVQDLAYEEEISQQGALQSSVPDAGPYPMALVLNTDSLNMLLSTVLDRDLPMVEQELETPLGNLDIQVQPALPQLEIAAVEGCPGCILTSMDFEIAIGNNVIGFTNGRGAASLSLPIGLAPSGLKSTSLMAQMDEATFQNISLQIEGFDTEDYPELDNILEDIATDYLRQELGAQEISTIKSWELGQGDMVLAARGPVIFPEQKTLLVGLHSNLSLSPTATLDEQATLPEGSVMGLQFHPELLLGTSQRLMTEGEIPASYDEDGATDDEGNNQVSLMAMQTTDDNDLRTTFRVWRTGGGLCGTLDMASSMSMTADTESVQIQLNDLEIVDSTGSGQFVEQGAWLGGDFLQSLTENLSLAVNYKDFAVEGERMKAVPSANSVTIDGRGVSVFLGLGIQEK